MPHWMTFLREPLNKYLRRHAGARQHPVDYCFDWILAFSRMTTKLFMRLVQGFLSSRIDVDATLSALRFEAGIPK